MFRIGKSINIEHGLKEDWWMSRAGQAEGNGEYGVSFGGDEIALKLDSDHGCTIL